MTQGNDPDRLSAACRVETERTAVDGGMPDDVPCFPRPTVAAGDIGGK